jgi:xylulokinase
MADPIAVLAIDLGTGGPKVAVFAESGELLASGVASTPIQITDDGGAEQDPNDWWRAIVAATRDALAAMPTGAPAPGAIAVTAQWATTVPVDEHGSAVGNVISWMDRRGAQYAFDACGPGPRAVGYNAIKIARWLRYTGGAPSLAGRDPIGQILFLQHERPDVYAAARYFVEPGDYLTARLTGRVVTAPETATMCWGTDTRDINAITYSDKLIRMSGLDPDRLAPIVPSNSVVGDVLPEVAAELGVDEIPVIASSPDVTSAAVGSGAVADGAAHLYIGTSGWLSCHLPKRKTDVLHQMAALPSSLPGKYLLATEQQTAGASLDHLKDVLLNLPGYSFEELAGEAEAAGLGANGVQFTPWLNGERTPLDDARIRGAYSNISLTATRGSLMRATLEGVAMNVRWMQHYTEKLAGSRHDSIAFIGGGASSDLWSQIFADVLGREIAQMDGPRQANVRGAALLALLGLDRITVDDIPSRVSVTQRFTPDPERARQYDALFSDFQKHYKATRRWHARRNDPAD